MHNTCIALKCGLPVGLEVFKIVDVTIRFLFTTIYRNAQRLVAFKFTNMPIN